MKKLLIIAVLFLTACGFTPVYKDMGQNDRLAAVKVEAPHNVMGQIFKNKLEDLLNPYGESVENMHRIKVELSKDTVALAIQQDRTVSRYKILITAKYEIYDMTSGEKIKSGSLKREGGYDKVESDYATYISDEDITRRISRELAEDVRVMLMAVLL